MLSQGTPVLVWTTVGMEPPRFSDRLSAVGGYLWYRNFHCVVVYGKDGSDLLVSDPLEGLIRRDLTAFAKIYDACGRMAVALG